MSLIVISCLILLSGGCTRLNEAENIEIEVWHNGTPLDCNAFQSHQQVWTIQRLAFFISNITLSNENTEQQVQMRSTPWQSDDVVLLQPYLPSCATKNEDEDNIEQDEFSDLGSLKTNNHLRFLVPVDLETSDQLSFTLAVPFALNHQNPLLQPSPLNLPNMFWSWRSGHKFFRFDMQGPNNNWVFHLGSVGCSAASTMRSPQKECIQPNRVNFKLNKQGSGTKLILHLDKLIANTTLQTSDSCLFHSGQESCAILMSNLRTEEVFEWQ